MNTWQSTHPGGGFAAAGSMRTVVGFGRELRDERERLGVPLEALADATKVPLRNLRALEDDHWTELPGGVFTRGIVRGYCKVLGLPESQWMERLTTAAAQVAAEPDWAEFAQNVKRNRVSTTPAQRRRWWGVALMLVTVIALAWACWHFVLKQRLPEHLSWPGHEVKASAKTGPARAVPLPQTGCVAPGSLCCEKMNAHGTTAA